MDYWPLFIFALTATATPGPNNMMMLSSGLNFGVRASVPHYLGICLGFPMMVLGVGVGVSYLFVRFPALHSVIQGISIIYLFYIAWNIARTDSLSRQDGTTKPLSFIQAVLFQWVNPKAWIMATTAISIYASAEVSLFDSIIIAGTFMSVAFPSVAIWLLFGQHLQRYFSDNTHLRIFNICMALLLIWAIHPAIIEFYSTICTLITGGS